jgi:hypothetical protein
MYGRIADPLSWSGYPTERRKAVEDELARVPSMPVSCHFSRSFLKIASTNALGGTMFLSPGKHLTLLALFVCALSFTSEAEVNAQSMYQKDGIYLNRAGGNIFGDSNINPNADPNINPMADPSINPNADPAINPLADPHINPNADPRINPGGDAYFRKDGSIGLKSEDN